MLRPLLYLCITTLLSVAAAASAQSDGATDGEAREALRQFLEANIAASESFDDRFDAEVWLVDMGARLTRYVPDADKRLQLLRQVHAAASRSDLAPELVLAVIEVESHFDRFAVSRVGAQGLMQVMPFWKDEIGRPGDNLTNNLTNLDYGCRILQFYLQRENGVLPRALAAYNGSSGSATYSDKVKTAWREHWRTGNLDWSD
ncbi:lytic transglycosylase domain-containing protein [Congregibacter litoralis]|uniref:Soluble lytic murein transglycosylase n=1 Tax=Congregibacter litoralis KT71 TaxID=314285 RepID=A4A9Q3_9GAMM|nr:lytic transglycosylase domain-containing protein [Congregibacter litoralis]EAQ97220.1 Soluble lytic murein transglycosylase [Congregibacter litoralis KT71]